MSGQKSFMSGYQCQYNLSNLRHVHSHVRIAQETGNSLELFMSEKLCTCPYIIQPECLCPLKYPDSSKNRWLLGVVHVQTDMSASEHHSHRMIVSANLSRQLKGQVTPWSYSSPDSYVHVRTSFNQNFVSTDMSGQLREQVTPCSCSLALLWPSQAPPSIHVFSNFFKNTPIIP